MGQKADQPGRILLVHPGIQQSIAVSDGHTAGVPIQIGELRRGLGSKKAEIDHQTHCNGKQQAQPQFDSVLQLDGHIPHPSL